VTLLTDDEVARSVCRLETVGRRTGLAREIEIWFAAHGDRVFMLAGGGDGAHWVRNVRANPAVRIRIGARRLAGRARVVDSPDDPDDRTAREAVAAKYEGWPSRPLSRWARESLPVVIDLSQ
jgi:deazaflavin-dependent oxidoreductase (nitroreductase family)